MGVLNLPAAQRARDLDNNPLPGAKMSVFVDHADVLAPVFADANLTFTLANPLLADDEGRFPRFHLAEGTYRIQVFDRNNQVVSEETDLEVRESLDFAQAHKFQSVAEVQADTILSYTKAQSNTLVEVDDIVIVANLEVSYTVADAAADDFHIKTAGGVKLYVVRNSAGAFCASAFGSAKSAATAQRAFDAVSAAPHGKLLTFSGFWQISETVTLPDPHNVTIDASAATFVSIFDGLMFDLNGRADPTYVDNESRQNFHWIGGRFGCSFTDPQQATMMRLFGMRFATVRRIEVGTTGTSGFNCGLLLAGKDTVSVADCKFFRTDRCIEIAPWSIIGGPLAFKFERLHGSLGGDRVLVKGYTPMTDSSVRDFSANMSNGASQVAIDIARHLCLGITNLSGDFQAGDTVTGATSGATAELVEVYAHHPFILGSHTTWLVLRNRTGLFQEGEAISGSTSGAQANIGDHQGYLSQNYIWQNCAVEGGNHFEAGSAAAMGAKCISLRDEEKAGTRPLNFTINAGSCGVNGGGATGIEVIGLKGVSLSGRFAQTEGSGVPIRIVDCSNLKLLATSIFSTNTGTIAIEGSTTRDDLCLNDFSVDYQFPQDLMGWGPAVPATPGTVATNSGAMIDMPTQFAKYETVGGLAPKAFGFRIIGYDDGSLNAAFGLPRVRLHHPDIVWANAFNTLNLNGVPDGERRELQCTVGCDAQGQVEYDSLETSPGSLSVVLNVVSMIF